MSDGFRPQDPDDGSLVIGGGVGGIRFQWEELDHAARVLALLAEDTADIAAALGYLEADFAVLPWRLLLAQHLGGVTGAEYLTARERISASWSSAAENGRALETAGRKLRSAVEAYARADDVARAVTGAARGVSAVAARALAREAIDRGALRVGPLEVQGGGGSPAGAAGTVDFDGTVEGVVTRIAAVEAEGAGAFEVLQLGTRAHPVYLVVLPGTQSGLIGGVPASNPFDAGGVAEALAEDSRYTGAAVLEALGRAGARDGDGLILAGYSQGGIHAVNLAGEAGLGGRFDVQLVVTVGSPTGWHRTDDTEYLHLEHAVDAVPGLDASPNPDDRHRTTVTLTHPVPPLGRAADGSPEPWGLGPAHKLENYAQGARLIDASSAPSLVPATALLAAAAGRTARRSSFTAVRKPDLTAVRKPDLTTVREPDLTTVRKPDGGPGPRPGEARAVGAGSRLWP